MKSIDYLDEKAADDAQVSDNPSGLYCPACRKTGLLHCAYPEECGGLRRMRADKNCLHNKEPMT